MNEHRIVCAWCNKILVPGPEPISHGICDSCREKVIEDLKEIKTEKQPMAVYA